MRSIIKPIFIISCLIIMNNACAQIECRLAEQNDMSRLLNLYEQMDTKDNENLFVPQLAIQKKILEKNITKKRLFVATDKENDILGFSKIYAITDHEELCEILTDRLRITNKDNTLNTYVSCCQYLAKPKCDVYNKKEFRAEPSSIDINVLNKTISDDKTLFVYVGSSYTKPPQGNQGINSLLKKFALDAIMKNYTKDKNHIALLYRQSMANINRIASIRELVRSLRDFYNNSSLSFDVLHYTFIFYIPNFGSKEKEGRSSIVIMPLPKQ